MNIEAGRVVTLSLNITDATTGEHLDGDPQRPSMYLHAYESMPKVIEELLEGREAQTDFDEVVENAFGPAPTTEPQALKRKELPRHWKVAPGFSFEASGSKGNKAMLYIHRVQGSRVYISTEHPWGGRAIRFAGTIHEVRNATMDERAHGHAHGPGGHHHG